MSNLTSAPIKMRFNTRSEVLTAVKLSVFVFWVVDLYVYTDVSAMKMEAVCPCVRPQPASQ
jgi:hypothetical protein